MDSILNRKKLNIDSITLIKPNVDISYKDLKQPSTKGDEWAFSKKPINILLKEGSLKYQMDEFRTLSIANFDIDLNYQNELKLFEVYA